MHRVKMLCSASAFYHCAVHAHRMVNCIIMWSCGLVLINRCRSAFFIPCITLYIMQFRIPIALDECDISQPNLPPLSCNRSIPIKQYTMLIQAGFLAWHRVLGMLGRA